MRFNLLFWKKDKSLIDRVMRSISRLPFWTKIILAIFLISSATSLTSAFLFEKYFGDGPLSNRANLSKMVNNACSEARDLSYETVDFENWPLSSSYGMDGDILESVLGYLEKPETGVDVSWIDELITIGEKKDGKNAEDVKDTLKLPTEEEINTAIAWLKENYPDYFAAKEKCDLLTEEFNQKYGE